MTHCLKHHPLINQTLLDLEEILNNTKCKTYNDKFRTGLRFIKIRVFQDKVQLIFITGKCPSSLQTTATCPRWQAP